jgi:Fe2+ or Zn2+ uptake regulation protein
VEKERVIFNTEDIFKYMSDENKILISNKELLNILNEKNKPSILPRTVQRWGIKFKVKKVDGKYLWNKKNIIKLEKWINRDYKRPIDYYYKNRPERPKKPKKDKSLITVEELIDELKKKGFVKEINFLGEVISFNRKNYRRRLQLYCKELNIPKNPYYQINAEQKEQIKKLFEIKEEHKRQNCIKAGKKSFEKHGFRYSYKWDIKNYHRIDKIIKI